MTPIFTLVDIAKIPQKIYFQKIVVGDFVESFSYTIEILSKKTLHSQIDPEIFFNIFCLVKNYQVPFGTKKRN
jgi:hypothetical protein